MSSNESDSELFSNPKVKSLIQKLENEISESKLELQSAKIKFEESKLKIEQQLESEKDKIKEEAKAELLQQLKAEKEQLDALSKKINDELKAKLISKITHYQKDANTQSLQKMSVDALKKYYFGVIQVEVAERKKEFKVTCPKCNTHLGNSTTHQEGVEIYKKHKAVCEKMPKSNYGKWIMLGIILSGLAVGLAFASQNKHVLKKKGKQDEPTS